VVSDADAKLAEANRAEEVKSWKNAFHAEQDNCEKLSKLLADTDAQFASMLAHNRDIDEAIKLIVDMLMPQDAAANPPLSLLAHTRQIPGRMGEYLRKTVKDTVE
jgi:hypothetical protein